MRRLRVVLLAVGLVIGASAAVVLTSAPAAQALSGSDFQAGNIISDGAFYDSGTMTAAQIQTFLNREYTGCNKGYVCIRDYTTKTTSQPAQSGLCSAYTGRASQSAASVIYSVAQACGVNPQSILVLLQKESGLITSWSPDYKTATGYGCPDNSGCAAKYYGFFNQVYLAAHQFKLYRLNPTNYSFVAGRSNYIQYDVSTKCGGSNVVIQNQATAGLYDYTPYQPNAASLAAMPGTGNSCSSYGNRNFWYYFTIWFGVPAMPYDAGGMLATTSSGALYYWPNTYGSEPSDPYHDPIEIGTSGWQNLPQLAVGDFTGDGLADVTVTRPDGSLWLYTNNGTMYPYGSPTEVRLAGWKNVSQLVAVDVNGDGRADLIARHTNGSLWLYVNTGDPSHLLHAGIELATSGWNAYSHIVGGDIDGDGLGDLVASRPDGSLWVFHSLGARGFAPGVEVRSSGFASMTQLVLTDIDSDGLADLEGRKSNGQLWLWHDVAGHADPFPTGQVIGSGWHGYNRLFGTAVPSPHITTTSDLILREPGGSGTLWSYADTPQRPVFDTPTRLGSTSWSGYAQVVVGVFEAGARADVLGVRSDGSLWLARNTGSGSTVSLSAPAKVGSGFTGFDMVVAGDVTGDGLADLVAREPNGTLWLARNTSSGSTVSFAAPVQIGTHGWSAYDLLTLVDFNGDGRADLVATRPGGSMWRFENIGATSRMFRLLGQTALRGWSPYTGLAGGDVDGSGGVQLLAARGSSIMLDADGGTDRFPRTVAVASTKGVSVAAVYLADVTGARTPDLVVRATDGALWLMPNLHTANQPYPTLTQIGTSGWNADTPIAAADFTGDGHTDLIAGMAGGTLWLRPYTGGAKPYVSAEEVGHSGWSSTVQLAGGDVSGDGRADLLALRSDGTLWYYRNSASGAVKFAAPIQIGGASWAGWTVLLADVNGNGRADLLARGPAGAMWLYPNTHNSSQPFTGRIQVATGFSDYTALAAGDVDHDGRADLLARGPRGVLWYFRNTGNPDQPFTDPVKLTVPGGNHYNALLV